MVRDRTDVLFLLFCPQQNHGTNPATIPAPNRRTEHRTSARTQAHLYTCLTASNTKPYYQQRAPDKPDYEINPHTIVVGDGRKKLRQKAGAYAQKCVNVKPM